MNTDNKTALLLDFIRRNVEELSGCADDAIIGYVNANKIDLLECEVNSLKECNRILTDGLNKANEELAHHQISGDDVETQLFKLIGDCTPNTRAILANHLHEVMNNCGMKYFPRSVFDMAVLLFKLLSQ